MEFTKEEVTQITELRIENLNRWIAESKANITRYECELTWLHAMLNGNTQAIDEARMALDSLLDAKQSG
jgi:hypothetical protein